MTNPLVSMINLLKRLNKAVLIPQVLNYNTKARVFINFVSFTSLDLKIQKHLDRVSNFLIATQSITHALNSLIMI